MKAVVLVGGQGTRLRPITYDTPKALVPLRNRPFMGYMLDFLRRGSLDGAVLSLGYLPDPIQAYLTGWDGIGEFSVDYAIEESALGTAGGIKNAEEYLDGDTFVVVNGDVLTGTDLVEAIKIHKASDALATVTLTSVEDPTAYGLVEVDHDMVVKRFLEKPAADEGTTNLVNAGVHALEPEVLGRQPGGPRGAPEPRERRRLRARARGARHDTGRTRGLHRARGLPRAPGAGAHAGPRLECLLARHRHPTQLPGRLPRCALRRGRHGPRGLRVRGRGPLRPGRQERQAPPAALGRRGLRARQPCDHRRPVLPRAGPARRAGRGRRGGPRGRAGPGGG